MSWIYFWQTIIGGIVLAIIGVLAAKWKKIWARIRAIWDSSAKPKSGLSHQQFEDLKDLLKPIQPDANGGKSLNDLHLKFDAFETEIRADVKEIKDRQVVIGDTTSRTEGSLNTHMRTPNAHERGNK